MEGLDDDEDLFKVESKKNSRLNRTHTAKSGTTERSTRSKYSSSSRGS